MKQTSRTVETANNRLSYVKLWSTMIIGFLFFLLPIKVDGAWTIPFDVFVSSIQDHFPQMVAFYVLLIILLSAVLSTIALIQSRSNTEWSRDFSYFRTSIPFLIFRLLGAVFAIMIVFNIGPEAVLLPNTGQLMYHNLVSSVAVIVPLGAFFVTLFVAFGGLEFIGTLSKPIMRPLFKVPGRASLDIVASIVASYSVGIYVTNKMYKQSRYSAKESIIIVTCFSSVSIGFFAVVASTLDLLHLFPLIFLSVTFVMIVLAAILVRIPPLSRKPDTFVGEPVEEEQPEGNLFKAALRIGAARAKESNQLFKELFSGLLDGGKLTILILPTILSIGLSAILIAEYTPVFQWIGKPMEPLIMLLGIPDAHLVAPASLVGIAEMFLPALFVVEAAVEAKFFIAVLSLSQVLFFSAVIPLLMEVDVPVTLKDMLILFVLRTLIAMPIIALITHIVF
ncbi:YjiH family protein [Geomicrobium sp. JCM 19039]|uniref:YjiH family protein n=1 Tax=Geomicrobium sp. JCM 19039 TaxID=1460636 RepID=UPI00045F2474|nr:YjiH family protein [Geomicrobium sp. JCM 19039]GAK13628.1 predicted histidine uptake transporter [Geomicrobium sp. JCM 19039]